VLFFWYFAHDCNHHSFAVHFTQDTHFIQLLQQICLTNLKWRPDINLSEHAIAEFASRQLESLSPPEDASEEEIAQLKVLVAREREYHAQSLSFRRSAAVAEAEFVAILHSVQYGTKFLWDAMLSNSVDPNIRVGDLLFVYSSFISFFFFNFIVCVSLISNFYVPNI
jgi:hypothetical protein